MSVNEAIAESTRSKRLKAATRGTHDVLDKRIMAGDIFASRDNFAKFLLVQYRFHRDIDVQYLRADLDVLLPELGERRRLVRIANDLSALGQALPPPAPGKLDRDVPLTTALGWLYVAEGSNVGGAVLFKLARERLGLDEYQGASHLAVHPDGVARHWREFTSALDALELTPQQEDEVVQAAEEAFRTVHAYVAEAFA